MVKWRLADRFVLFENDKLGARQRLVFFLLLLLFGAEIVFVVYTGIDRFYDNVQNQQDSRYGEHDGERHPSLPQLAPEDLRLERRCPFRGRSSEEGGR